MTLTSAEWGKRNTLEEVISARRKDMDTGSKEQERREGI